MDSFNWADSIRATLGTCIPCIKASPDSDGELENASRGHVSARDELERLLDEPLSDEDNAETMSLHSNVGVRRRTAAPKPRKSIRLFGVDLFGKRPIRNSVEQDDEETHADRDTRRPRAISTSTLDSDAAPLADDAIAGFTAKAHQRWAPPQTDEELAAEELREQERLEQEAQRERRRERKQIKKLAALGAFSGSQDFEGFPGSGSGAPPTLDEFGPFIGHPVQQPEQLKPDSGEDREEDADFGATAYTKKRRTAGSESSRSGSGSHSRTRSTLAPGDSNDTTESKRTQEPVTPKKQRLSPTSILETDSPARKSKTKPHGKSTTTQQSKSSTASSSSVHSPTLVLSPDVKIQSHEFDGQFIDMIVQ